MTFLTQEVIKIRIKYSTLRIILASQDVSDDIRVKSHSSNSIANPIIGKFDNLQ